MREKIDFSTSPHMQDVEYFMHQSLRPILKEKNDLLREVCMHFMLHMEKRFNYFPFQKQQELLGAMIQKNAALRNQLIGISLASMRDEELLFYFKNHKELNKRILQMAEVRILSQYLKKDELN